MALQWVPLFMKVDYLIKLLTEALNNKNTRATVVACFQNEVWNSEDIDISNPIHDVFRELAHDLDYYEPDPKNREDENYSYGDDKLEMEIKAGLDKISKLKNSG
jgi:hypothetical protein